MEAKRRVTTIRWANEEKGENMRTESLLSFLRKHRLFMRFVIVCSFLDIDSLVF
jgi:hypothetical protein